MKYTRKKLNYKRFGILVFLCILLLSGAVFGVWKLYGFLKLNPYEQYTVYKEDNKIFGTIKQTYDSYEEENFVSFTYPFYDDKALDNIVKAYEEKEVEPARNTKNQITSIDYASNLVNDRFVNLVFDKHTYSNDGKEKDVQKKYYLYDNKAKKQLNLSDVLRRDYPALLDNLKKDISYDKKIDLHTTQLSLTPKELQVHLDKDATLSISFEKYKKYIKLKDKNIPSLYQKEPLQAKEQPKIDPNKKMIAFTFDDGPGAYTSEIMDLFDKYNGRATFFMVGNNIKYYEDTVKDIYTKGFELGNHSWNHSDRIGLNSNNLYSVSEIRDNIYKTQDEIYKICGEEPKWFRPPFGAVSKNLLDANYLGYTLWDIDTLDWKFRNTPCIKENILNGLKYGNIVILMHDIHKTSMESLKEILPILHEKGYQFVTYSTLMEHEKDYLTTLSNRFGVPTEKALGI